MEEKIFIDQDDVTVHEIARDECEDCDEIATHFVQLDLRSVGQATAVGKFCQAHAEELAERLRSSLPPSNDCPSTYRGYSCILLYGHEGDHRSGYIRHGVEYKWGTGVSG